MASKAKRSTAAAPKGRAKGRKQRPIYTGPPVTADEVRIGAALIVCKHMLGKALDAVGMLARAQIKPSNETKRAFAAPKLRPDRGTLLLPAQKHFLYMAARSNVSVSDMCANYNVGEEPIHTALVSLALGAKVDPKDLEGVNWPEVN